MLMDIATIERAAEEHGLKLRGGFHPEAADRVPTLADGAAVRTLILLGNVGAGLWESFNGSAEFADGRPDPLNRWSERVIGLLAAALGAAVHFPFGGPPHLPFVPWAKRAEPVVESPLGMLIHPDYGLWHAYRGALAFAETVDLPPQGRRAPPCDSCADKPCLTACPVDAFTASGYNVAACGGHIATVAGADCMELGCRARRACPIGREYHYNADQARFHMAAFLRARSLSEY